MRVVVEEDKCIGAGMCVMAAPQVFDQREEDGIVIVLESQPEESERGNVDEAAVLCPARVIAVEG